MWNKLTRLESGMMTLKETIISKAGTSDDNAKQKEVWETSGATVDADHH